MPLTSPSGAPQSRAAPAPPHTVLVVDDELLARISLAARLTRLGYWGLEAGDGRVGV
ncbi:MAG: hypothetical protein EWM72_00161 [Nitrospira sp.]|nr:MAG: hypothetical protein EWM72_00161 [Nitrospira sp.]